MIGLFHKIAAERGEGLVPELQQLFAPVNGENVVELAALRIPVAVRAGPAPNLRGEVGVNVVAFAPKPLLEAEVEPDTGKLRRPRVSRARNLARAKG